MNINDPKPAILTAEGANRLPFLDWIPITLRNHFVAGTGEFVGTFLFLFFAFSGTQIVNTKAPTTQVSGGSPKDAGANTSNLLYISLCFGFSLAVNAWVFFRISGGLFNPAVTLGMCVVKALPWMRGLVLFIAQMLGALASAGICSALFPGDLVVDTELGGGTSVVQGLFIEAILTAQLVFTIFMLAAEKHKSTYRLLPSLPINPPYLTIVLVAPIGIGLSLFIAELTGVYFTGGSLNPARSFAPAAVNHKFPKYHWLYWIGPIIGSLVAAGFYEFIKILEYETANPNQDSKDNHPDKHHDDLEAGTHEPRASHSREGRDARPISTGPPMVQNHA